MSTPPLDIKTCKCGARYVQRQHQKADGTPGNWAPIEHAPSERGNIRILANGRYTIIPKKELADYQGDKFLNHFAFCPKRQDFGGRS